MTSEFESTLCPLKGGWSNYKAYTSRWFLRTTIEINSWQQVNGKNIKKKRNWKSDCFLEQPRNIIHLLQKSTMFLSKSLLKNLKFRTISILQVLRGKRLRKNIVLKFPVASCGRGHYCIAENLAWDSYTRKTTL